LKSRYYSVHDGICLLREGRDENFYDFRVLRRGGEWGDGRRLGVNYVIGEEIGAEEISLERARTLAAELGGSLDDSSANGPPQSD
jgi:hypothetical protein